MLGSPTAHWFRFNLSSLPEVLGLAAAYFVISKLGLLLAIPPGYATAVWPASGIALGCLLIYGVRLWPGVMLGSALVNLSVSPDLSSASALIAALPVPLAIGLGAAMQAVLGASLVRRFVGFPTALDEEQDVFRFLGLGGPLACLLNATVGSLALLVAGTVSSQSIPITWLTWWVGDAIGVMIFTPMIMIALAEPRGVWKARVRTVGMPLSLAFAVSVGIFYSTQSDSWAVLAGALLFTGLLGAFLLVVAGQKEKIVRLVDERTSQLRSQEAQLSAILKHSPMKIHIKDTQGRFTLMNPAAEGLFGRSDPHEIGATPDDALSPDEADAFAAHDRRVIESGEAVEVEEVFHLADGIHTYLTIKFPIFGPDGVIAVGGIGTDITARKTAEDALSDAIESISEGFILFDADERMIVCNSKYRDYYPALDDILTPGLTIEQLVNATADRQATRFPAEEKESWAAQRLAQFRTAMGSHEHQLQDGRWLQVTERRTNAGGIVGIRTDITDIIRAQQEMAATKEIAEYANRTKTEFLANMSHELRTPLNAIIGFSSILSSGIYGENELHKYREYGKDIQKSGEHLLQLLSDLLDLSKIEMGEVSIETQEMSPENEVRACLRMVLERANTAGVKLLTRFDDSPLTLNTNVLHFRQILLNLLSNAIKFTPHGGRVEIRLQRSGDDDVVLRVIDTGIGIDPADVPRIMEPFGQASEILTRNHEGAGLGLSIVSKLVELHDGEIEIDSMPGKGTAISVTFRNMAA